MLTPASELKNAGFQYLQKTNKKILFLYFCLVTVFLCCILSLPFLYVDISVVAPGVIRPYYERTEVKSSVPGYIRTIHYKEGQLVNKDSAIISLRLDEIVAKSNLLKLKLSTLQNLMHDLKILTASATSKRAIRQSLYTSLYKEQLSSFQHKNKQHLIGISKSEGEVNINKFLSKEKVISQKELSDKEAELQTLQASLRSYQAEQLLRWQEELSRLESEHQGLKAEEQQLIVRQAAYSVKAPISGVLQMVSSNYAGSFVQAGETLCIISPEAVFIAECILTGKEVAMVKTGQRVRLRIDAFNYSYFGMLSGKVLSVDNDFTVIEKKPVFKIRCSLDDDKVQLKNGFTGHIKKGLTVQASLILTRRSLWQLLFDKFDDWLNPQNQQNQQSN